MCFAVRWIAMSLAIFISLLTSPYHQPSPKLVMLLVSTEPTPMEEHGCLKVGGNVLSSLIVPGTKPLHMLFLMPVIPFQLSPPQPLYHTYLSSCLIQNPHHGQGLLPSLSFCTPDPNTLPLELETNLTVRGVTSVFHSLAHSHLTKHLLQGTYRTRY